MLSRKTARDTMIGMVDIWVKVKIAIMDKPDITIGMDGFKALPGNFRVIDPIEISLIIGGKLHSNSKLSLTMWGCSMEYFLSAIIAALAYSAFYIYNKGLQIQNICNHLIYENNKLKSGEYIKAITENHSMGCIMVILLVLFNNRMLVIRDKDTKRILSITELNYTSENLDKIEYLARMIDLIIVEHSNASIEIFLLPLELRNSIQVCNAENTGNQYISLEFDADKVVQFFQIGDRYKKI
jgi:hypothetical protein